jgi:hypothetical protein
LIFNNLVFRGGTALKKAYFSDYRFSEDLDFTLIDSTISKEILFSEFEKIFEFIKEEANIPLETKNVQEYKSWGSLSFHINYLGPLGGKLGIKDLKIDITRNEILEFETLDKKIFAPYSDLIKKEFKIKCKTWGQANFFPLNLWKKPFRVNSCNSWANFLPVMK